MKLAHSRGMKLRHLFVLAIACALGCGTEGSDPEGSSFARADAPTGSYADLLVSQYKDLHERYKVAGKEKQTFVGLRFKVHPDHGAPYMIRDWNGDPVANNAGDINLTEPYFGSGHFTANRVVGGRRLSAGAKRTASETVKLTAAKLGGTIDDIEFD
jgi:hypothetical protein